METLVLNGKTYVKASKAARDLGYTADYVGQLCRSGSVDAHLVGRTWYVHADKLGEHRVEKKRMSRVKAREQAHKSIEEHKKKASVKNDNNYHSVAIRYESDDRELMPAVRKVSVTPEARIASRVVEDPIDDAPYEVLNAGEKVQMSGKLKIVDVSDDVPDADTTLLEPKLIRKKKVAGDTMLESRGSVALHAIEDDAPEDPDSAFELVNDADKTPASPTRMSFMDRLQVDSEVLEAADTIEDNDAVYEDGADASYGSRNVGGSVLHEEQKKTSVIPYVLAILSVLLLAAGTICIESEYQYVAKNKDGSSVFDSTFKVDTSDLTAFLHYKI